MFGACVYGGVVWVMLLCLLTLNTLATFHVPITPPPPGGRVNRTLRATTRGERKSDRDDDGSGFNPIPSSWIAVDDCRSTRFTHIPSSPSIPLSA